MFLPSWECDLQCIRYAIQYPCIFLRFVLQIDCQMETSEMSEVFFTQLQILELEPQPH